MRREEPYPNPVMWWSLVVMIVTLILLAGCAAPAHPPLPPTNTIPDAATSVEKARGHVESADALVQRAKPEANATGKALLGAATDEHTKAEKDLVQAKADLVKVQAERDEYAAQVQDQVSKLERTQAQLAKVKSGWGYRLQVFVASIFWTLVILTILHFVLGAASIFVAGPLGIWLGRIGGILNPGSWFQWFRDHMHFKRNCPDASTP